MSSLQEIREGFIRIYEDIVRAKGLPTIMGRILAVLLLEGRELDHKEISSLTGYSIASVNRTLNQLVNFGMVHKHKDAQKKCYVFHMNIDFLEIFADSLEKMVKVYGKQRDELAILLQKVDEAESDKKEQAEINHLRVTLENFDKMLGITMGVLENTIKELHSKERPRLSPEK
jgi:DNA-binding transcriptional regulator GbsR (MarR family)